MWPVKTRLAVVAVVIALFASSGVIVWQSRELADARQQQAATSRDMKDVRARLRKAELELAAVRQAAAGESDGGEEAVVRKSGQSNLQALAQRDVQIGELRKALSDAKGVAAHLQERVAAFDDERTTISHSANDRYTTAQSDWQARFNDLTQQVEQAKAEAKSAQAQTAELEKSITHLKQQDSDSAAKIAETSRLIANLQELSRRRDTYLTAVLRRYRDVTNQFRAMSGMLDSNREQSSSALSGPALTRIQTTISMAEDDLRQLNEVNAQAQQLERKLAKR